MGVPPWRGEQMQERSSLPHFLPWVLGKNDFSCSKPREGTPKEPLVKLGCLNPPPTLVTILSEGLADGRHCWWDRLHGMAT